MTPYEILIRATKDGKIGGMSGRTLDDNGKESDPFPLNGVADPFFKDFARQFKAETVAELEAVRAEHKTALEELTAEHAEALATLQAERAEVVKQYETRITELTTSHAEQVDTLQARLSEAETRHTEQLAELAAAEGERNGLFSQLENMTAERNGLQTQLESMTAECQQAKQETAEAVQKVADIEATFPEAKQVKEMQRQREIEAVKSQLETLREKQAYLESLDEK